MTRRPRVIRVLCVEDDQQLARLTASYLESHDLEVHVVPRGDVAIADVDRIRPDVVLLDLSLPDMTGLEVCRRIRARHSVPIIMVTGQTDLADRVRGLEHGADDYVSKPYEPAELLARIQAQARRARGDLEPRVSKLVVGPLVVDTATRTVQLRGAPIVLTTTELAIVTELAYHPGRILNREQLLHVIHGSADEVFDRAIDVLISRIRAKIEDDPKNPQLLKTVRRAGYVLTSPDDPT
jgi:two-component system OmpR family response regulator